MYFQEEFQPLHRHPRQRNAAQRVRNMKHALFRLHKSCNSVLIAVIQYTRIPEHQRETPNVSSNQIIFVRHNE
jgi:hypothetical protein